MRISRPLKEPNKESIAIALPFKTAARIVITGDTLDPDEITNVLKCVPQEAAKKGEPYRRVPEAFPVPAQTGTWSKSVEKRCPGDLDAQIVELLDGMNSDLGNWRNLADRFRIRAFCGVFMSEWNEAFYISPSTLGLIAERGIALDIDIYGQEDIDVPE